MHHIHLQTLSSFSILHIHSHGALCRTHKFINLSKSWPRGCTRSILLPLNKGRPTLTDTRSGSPCGHPPKCGHCGHHHLLPEGQIPAEAGAEKAHGVCAGGNSILKSVSRLVARSPVERLLSEQ